MEEIKQHCEKVIQMLRLDYPAQLQYPGSIKKIYDVMLQEELVEHVEIRECLRNNG